MKRYYFRDLRNNYFSPMVGYISGSDALPHPLSLSEEEALAAAAECGDELAKTALIEHNLRLVVYIARKFDSAGTALDDLISIGTIGLIKAVRTFRLERGIKLATYASKCIENEILMYLRKTSRQRAEISLEEPLNSDGEGNELTIADILCTTENPVIEALEHKSEIYELDSALNRLSASERRLIVLRYGLYGQTRRTQKEVAELMRISQSYISRLEKKIVKNLQKELTRC